MLFNTWCFQRCHLVLLSLSTFTVLDSFELELFWTEKGQKTRTNCRNFRGLIKVLAVDTVVIVMMYLSGGLISLDVIIKMIFVIHQILKIFWVNLSTFPSPVCFTVFLFWHQN